MTRLFLNVLFLALKYRAFVSEILSFRECDLDRSPRRANLVRKENARRKSCRGKKTCLCRLPVLHSFKTFTLMFYISLTQLFKGKTGSGNIRTTKTKTKEGY